MPRSGCAPIWTASRPSRDGWRRSRSDSRRSTGCSESTAARSSPVLAHRDWLAAEIERLEDADELGAELGRRLAAAGERRDRARRRAERRASETQPARLADRARRGAGRAGDGGGDAERDARARGRWLRPGRARRAVELQLATNPGMPASPLRDAASGGELSRVMLALSVLAAPGHDGRRAHPGLRRDRRGHRRPGRPRSRRAPAHPRRRPPARLHHPPSPGRLARGHPLPDREARRAGGDARRPSSRVDGDELVAEICRMLGAERARRGGQPARTRAPRRRLRTRLKGPGGGGGGAEHAVGILLGRWPAPFARAPASSGSGATRAGGAADRRTGSARPQDQAPRQAPSPRGVAIIDHADLDRVAAEDLVASGVRAVVNVAPSVERSLSRTPGRCCSPGPGSA